MQLYKRNEGLMGSKFCFAVLCPDEKTAIEFLKFGVAEVWRLEQLLSEYIPNSATSQINNLAHKQWVSLDEETYQLIKRSLALSKLSSGDFDITTSPLKQIFNFKGGVEKLPSKNTIDDVLQKVGFEKIELDDQNRRVRFLQEGMKISFAAIGKGFAADVLAAKWRNMGLAGGFVDASGDIKVIGEAINGNSWISGIANPDKLDKALLQLNLKDNAIATSGNSEQFFVSAGQKYSHNINPKTGKPLQFIKSVSVISPSAELSDALATAAYVKGIEKGIHFINQLPNTHAIFIDEYDNIHLSENLEYESIDIHISDAISS